MPIQPKPVIPGRVITKENFSEVLNDAAYDNQITMEEAEVLLEAVEANPDAFDTLQINEVKDLVKLVGESTPQMAAMAVKTGNVGTFRSALSVHIDAMLKPEIEISDSHSAAELRLGIPLDSAEALDIEGPEGTAFLVGGGRNIENLEVRLRPIRHSIHGDGYEARFKVSRQAGNSIESLLAKQPETRLVEKKIRDHGITDDGVVNVHSGDEALTQEEKDAATMAEHTAEHKELSAQLTEWTGKLEAAAGDPAKVSVAEAKIAELKPKLDKLQADINKLAIGTSVYNYGSSNDGMTLGHCIRLSEPGKFRIDYFPEEVAKQALRGSVHIEAFGETEAEKKANLKAAMAMLEMDDELQAEPSEDSLEILRLMRLLWQSSPELAAKVSKSDDLTLDAIHDALDEAKVPDDFIDSARFAEVAPGHVSVVVPGQAEAYREAGVTGLIHTIQNTDKIVDIIAGGALSSTQERLGMRKVIKGMSSATDLKTGGAEYVFTRVITEKMGNPKATGAVISFNTEILDRTDWFAYPTDKYGSTYMNSEAEEGTVSDAVKEIVARTNPNAEAYLNKMRSPRNNSQGSNSFYERPTGRELVKAINEKTTSMSTVSSTRNEAMFQGHISLSMMNYIVVPNEQQQQDILTKLEAQGITEVNGQPASEFVRVQANLYPETPENDIEHTDYI